MNLVVEFDLEAEIVKALRGDEPDPHEIAAKLVDEIPEGEIRALLEHALMLRICTRLRTDRPSSNGSPRSKRRMGSVSGGVKNLRYYVGVDAAPDHMGWKMLGECTVEDLEVIMVDYRARAVSNLKISKQFESLREKLAKRRGAQTVDDLPDAVLKSVFG